MEKLNISTNKYPNRFIIVDDDAPDEIFKYKWGSDERGYTRRNKNGNIVYLHRVIVGREGGVVDHINRNTFDNRRCNLRIVDKTGNLLNSGLWRHNKSGYKGVSWSKSARKWLSRMQYKGKTIHFGLFDNIEDAAKARVSGERFNVAI